MSKPTKYHQQGGVLLIFMLVMVLAGMATLFNLLDNNRMKIDRDKRTSAALAEAKNALLGYAVSVNLVHPGCGTNCRRLGDLPCPDTNNDGVAETSCGNAAGTTGQANRLGRLPWKTLGLDDLRDGNGDRLWYAVSNRFKQSTRAFPLNSDTFGSISIRDSSGNLVNDATSSSGVVAVVISAGIPITRQDGIVQSRTIANENNAVHYLDNTAVEDNANFIDGDTNGFIKGVIIDAAGNTVTNDQLIVISRSDMMQTIEPRVASEVKNEMVTYSLLNPYPAPASFSDTTCLGTSNINSSSCLPNALVNRGRVPVNPVPDWGSTSILNGISNNNWFQQNGWRELIYYTQGSLILMPENTNKSLIVIATGSVIGGQARVSNADKTLEPNYLELENQSPLDDTYLHLPLLQHNSSFNDFLVSVP